MNKLASSLVIAGVLSCFAAPSSAEPRIKEIKLDRDQPAVHIMLKDNGDHFDGPYTTYVFVRANQDSQWALARQFQTTTAMSKDQESTLDLTVDNELLNRVAMGNHKHWEARAVIKNRDDEKVSVKSEPFHYWDTADR
jgi:hypothetical protein